MSTARSSFTLKPSALSQHTANFNRLLEQVPAPRIESLDLSKSLESHNPVKKPEVKEEGSAKPLLDENKEAIAAPAKEFVFGEKLTDRVINTESTLNDIIKPSITNGEEKKEQSSDQSATEPKASNNSTSTATTSQAGLWSNENTSDHDAIENNEANTIMKLSCKLFVLNVLETDKVDWVERGYGILKVIDSNDGVNCKMMMWTDKCFRLILNTKFFEKMKIDKASKKSIRFNAFDNGTIRIFLIKTGNQNDCDELYEILTTRLHEFLEKSSKLPSSSSDVDNAQKSNSDTPKSILFKCECNFYNLSQTSGAERAMPGLIHLYTLSFSSGTHQLLLDIVDRNDNSTILLSTYLKLVKIKKNNSNKPKKVKVTHDEETGEKTDYLFEFNVDQPSTSVKQKQKYKIEITNKENAHEFLNHYNKEPKLRTILDDSSNGGFDKDEDDDEISDDDSVNSGGSSDDNDEQVRKSSSINESERFSNSTNNSIDDDSKNYDSQETSTEGNKKRKNIDLSDDSQSIPTPFKKQEVDRHQEKLDEDDSSSAVSSSKRKESQESSSEEQNQKKTKLSVDEPTSKMDENEQEKSSENVFV